MTTIKTPTRTVAITMTITNPDGTIGIDYSGDYIGNLVDANLRPCDCEDAEHTYHADDATADWWYDHCSAAEAMEDRIQSLSHEQRERFRAEAESRSTFACDTEYQPVAGGALLDEMFGAEE